MMSPDPNILNLEMSLINDFFKSCERVGLVIILVKTNVEESDCHST